MKWALIGLPAILVTAGWISGTAQAIPTAPRLGDIAAAPSPLLLSVRYHRHHWHHHWHRRFYRHYGLWRHWHPRWARYAAPERTAAGTIKPGRWEFIAQLQTAAPELPASTPLPPETEPQSGGGIKTSYSGCITSDKAVPAEFGPQCRLDSSDRKGPRITWSMTCTNAKGAVRSDGVATYAGDTMEATMTSHLPGANGKMTDITQRITGRYAGACGQYQQ